MTEKRFQIIGENYTNIDVPVFIVCRENNCCFEVYESKEDAQRVCDKLNALIDENEQLKKENEEYRQILLDFGVRTIFKENTVLRDGDVDD